MKIKINQEVADAIGLNEHQLLEVLAVSLYKMEKINGVQGGKLLGSSEVEFHGVLSKYGKTVNYDVKDFLDDIENLKDF